MNKKQFAWAGLMVGTAAGAALAQQASFTGVYTQNFDGLFSSGTQTVTGRGPHAIDGLLGATGLEGWYGANPGGSSSNTEFRAQNGSLAGSSGRGVVSFGSDGSGERALGTLATSNQINSFGLLLRNDTAETFESVRVRFVGEQWRAGGANIPNTLAFLYGIGASIDDADTDFAGLDFNTPVLTGGEIALNGNDPANQAVLDAVIAGVNWEPGQTLVLRWNGSDLNGQDNGLAIDDLRVVGIIPTPGAMAMLGLGCLLTARRRR